MERERLNGNDWRWIGIAVVVAAISLWVAHRYFHHAFPEASIDFRISGPGSASVAQRFLQAQGLAIAGFQHAEQFGYDDQTKTFLERELGLARTEALLGSRLQLWRWQNRWFKPLDQEELDVDVTPSGAIAGFDHVIAADAAGASLTEEQAQTRALAFVRALGADPSAWTLIGSEREARPQRVDYTFTWKDAAPLVSGATGVLAQTEHRHVVRIQGDAVGAYSQYVRVPEEWTRSYARLRSRNETTGLVDTGLILVLFVALLFVLVMRIRRGDMRWRVAGWVAAAGFVLSLLSSLNGWGAARFAYDTTQAWNAFVASTLLSFVASAVGVGVFFFVLTAAAESLYRERFQEQIAVGSFLSWRGVRSKSFLMSMVLGLALAALFFAYQTVFYLIANHWGAWAPADVPYDQLLNTRLPWAFVLFSGFFPAISEEFGFRMFALPLLEKWLRWMWVAVIAASFIWGFGHATYPNQPFYIRGVEVGLGGILLSWVMIRFGILATVVWHYTVDALYTAMLLLGAHDAYLRWSGAATAFMAVLPLLIAVGAYWRYGGFAPAPELTNAAAGTAPPLPAAPAEAAPLLAPYDPIPGPNWTMGLIVAAALLSAFAVPRARWSSVLPWRTDAQQAVAAGRRFLLQQGYDTGAYRATATLAQATQSGHGEENAAAAAAIFAQGGPRALHRAFAGTAPAPAVVASYWRLRFFRILQPEEFAMAVRPDNGRVIAFSHTLPQTAPGAAPAQAAAQAAAQAFLEAQGLPVASMALKTAAQQQRPARTDSTFVWEAASAPAGTDKPGYRAGADLQGDHIGYFAAWYHVSEASLRAFERGTLAGTLLGVLKGLMYAAAAALVFWLLFGFARHQRLRWASLLKVAAAAGVLLGIAAACTYPATLATYPTDTPWSAFLLSAGMGWVVSGLAAFLLTLALLAALAVVVPQASALTVANARRQLERDSAWDALWAALLALAWTAGWEQTRLVINGRWHAAGWPLWPQPPAGLEQLAPGLADMLTAPVYALWIGAGLGILAPVLWRTWRGRPVLGAGAAPPVAARAWWCVGGVVLLWIGTFPALHSPAQFAAAAIFAGVSWLLVLGFAALFLRASPLAYYSAALVPLLVLPGIHWLATPAPGARLPGVILVALAGAWLGWLAWMARGSRPSQRTQGQTA